MNNLLEHNNLFLVTPYSSGLLKKFFIRRKGVRGKRGRKRIFFEKHNEKLPLRRLLFVSKKSSLDVSSEKVLSANSADIRFLDFKDLSCINPKIGYDGYSLEGSEVGEEVVCYIRKKTTLSPTLSYAAFAVDR